jgi:hypothetical protein
MKLFSISISVLILSIGIFYYHKRAINNAFLTGTIEGSKAVLDCWPNDDSKKNFPEYFAACDSLCDKLYKTKNLCVPTISGGAIVCVCGQ